MGVGEVDGEIGIHPDLHVATVIHTDLVLLYIEVLGVLEDLTVPLQGLHDDVEIVGKGNIADLADSDLDCFYVHLGSVAVRTNLITITQTDEAGVHEAGLPASPVERLQVIQVLLLIRPDKIVLADTFIRLPVAQGAVEPVLLSWLVLFYHVLPLGGVEGWGLDVD